MTLHAPPTIRDREFRRRLLTGGKPMPDKSQQAAIRRSYQVPRPALAIVRIVIGWIVIVIGLAGVILPMLPAIVLLPVGVALVGRHSRALKYTRTSMKLLLRRTENWKGAMGRFGRWARDSERKFSKKMRHKHLARWEKSQRPSGRASSLVTPVRAPD